MNKFCQDLNRVICLFLLGGLADEVTEDVLRDAFVPFGDLVDIQIPLDYETEKHRGFAFVEFELPEDAAAAIDNMVCIRGWSVPSCL